MSKMKRPAQFRRRLRPYALIACAIAAFGAGPILSQERPVPDTFEATTTGMTPEGLKLKLDILSWSDADGRAAVTAALAADGDPAAALAELPTVGVVWREGSAVGHSLKYAYRDSGEGGRQKITVVTDKPIDAYSFNAWRVPGKEQQTAPGYTVIELNIDEGGHGTGTLSLAADVDIDTAAGMVALRAEGAATVLTDAHEVPKPYWARTDSGR